MQSFVVLQQLMCSRFNKIKSLQFVWNNMNMATWFSLIGCVDFSKVSVIRDLKSLRQNKCYLIQDSLFGIQDSTFKKIRIKMSIEIKDFRKPNYVCTVAPLKSFYLTKRLALSTFGVFQVFVSTANLLSVVSDRITGALNRSGDTQSVALFISKAFDRVWYISLLQRL